MGIEFANHVNDKMTPQDKAIPGRENEMAKNNAGGFTFALDHWKQFERFLILGTEGGTYYVSEKDLTKENVVAAKKCISEDGIRAVKMIVDISDSGRALKNEPALYALALAASCDDVKTRTFALEVLPKVARIGTHLFHFVHFIENMRGWGKSLRRAIGNWYIEKDNDALSYQAIKYQQRDGWSHRDLLRLSHPKTSDEKTNATLRWIVNGIDGVKEKGLDGLLHKKILGFEQIKLLNSTQVSEAAQLVTVNNLPREAIPTHFMNSSEIWEAMLYNRMPMTAMIRNLNNLSKVGLLEKGSEAEKIVMEQLTNAELLKKARIHPISVLIALKQYSSGHGLRGSSTWPVNQQIVNALDEAFYKTFTNVEPSNRRHMLAVDVSGSMGGSRCVGVENLTAREAAAAMALVTANVEKDTEIFGFNNTLTRLRIDPRQRLDDVMRVLNSSSFGSTDCAAPFIWALENKQNFEAFCVYTDNETGSGSYYGSHRRSEHPSQALVNYRQKMGIPAQLAVIATSTNGFTIADPKDSGMIDIVGFDGSVPTVLADFFRK